MGDDPATLVTALGGVGLTLDAIKLQHLDWEHDPPCEEAGCETQQVARWRAESVCGCVELLCDPCRATWVRKAAAFGNRLGDARCPHCGWRGVCRFRDTLVRLEPLT